MEETEKKKGGRPTKLTEATLARFIALVRAGNYGTCAAAAIGIKRQVFYRWLERGAADEAAGRNTIFARFNTAYAQASAEAEAGCVATIRRASTDNWTAAAWLLERKFPDRWSRKERMEVSGPGGGPVESTQTVSLDLTKLADADLEQLERILTIARSGDGGEDEEIETTSSELAD